MGSSRSAERPRRASPLLLLLATAVSLLAVEGVLRVYAATSATSLAEALGADPYDVLVEPHGEAGYRPRPDRAIPYANGTVATTNAAGYRGPRVSVPKPDGVFRIVLLGGSTTFGWGVDDGETIDAHLRNSLATAYPDREIDVVNLAFDGYDSYQVLERLRTDGVRLEPDVMVVNSGINDVRNAWFRDIRDGDDRTLLYQATLYQLRFEEERGAPTLWTRAKHLSYLARAPGWLRAQFTASSTSTNAIGQRRFDFYWEAVDYFERNLTRVVEIADHMGAAVLFSTPPSSLLTKYEPDDPPIRSYWLHDARSTQIYRDSLDARMRRLVDERAKRGFSVDYVPHASLDPDLFLDDAHLTPDGNRLRALHISQALRPLIERTTQSGP